MLIALPLAFLTASPRLKECLPRDDRLSLARLGSLHDFATQKRWHHSARSRQSSRRALPNCVPRLHPVGIAPEGVPSSLFTFRPKPSHPRNTANTSGVANADNLEGDLDPTTAIATVATEESLQAGVVEESDLDGVAALLVESFPAGLILADGEFSELEGVIIGAPLQLTNNYLQAVAYYEVLYALKSRCHARLIRGDFALSSEALVIAVRDSVAPMKEDDGNSGRIVAVVELVLRKPDGSLPTNWPFPVPWRRAEPAKEWEPYMCNLAVAEAYRGQGYGKQLVRLCEHVAKNHWGYERMHLHVDMNDPKATGLYSSMGYESMEQYDAPKWMRRLFGMPTIRYQVKQFKGRRGAPL